MPEADIPFTSYTRVYSVPVVRANGRHRQAVFDAVVAEDERGGGPGLVSCASTGTSDV